MAPPSDRRAAVKSGLWGNIVVETMYVKPHKNAAVAADSLALMELRQPEIRTRFSLQGSSGKDGGAAYAFRLYLIQKRSSLKVNSMGSPSPGWAG